ncbi:MAG: hypothetical protein LBM63_04940 [Rikenellaceae bacterium]|jgi:hypothetical protein|nr:hypothetical protein [Rikenellaceae bacterium]
MKKIVILGAAVALAAVSCAEPEVVDGTLYEKQAFAAWMSQYGPSDAALQPNGMYVEVLEEGDPTDRGGATADADVWVRLNYTSTTLSGEVYATRSEEVALRQGIYTPHTYYVPDFLYCGAENVSMIEGRYYALKNPLTVSYGGSPIKLYKGSKVRLYMPSTLAYGTSGYSDDQGYGGQFPLDASRPIIETLEVVEVLEDPIALEESLVKDLAEKPVAEGGWGLTEANLLPKSEAEIEAAAEDDDTENDGKYFEHFYIDSMYRAAEAVPFDKTQLLTVDSTARIWYVQKFLPKGAGGEGFITETNIKEVYDRFYNRQKGYEAEANSAVGTVVTYTPTDDKSNRIPAWYDMIPKMRRGRWYRVVFSSAYGYGASGHSSAMEANQAYYNYYMQMMMNSYLYNNSSSYYGDSYYNNYYNPYYSGMSYLSTSTDEDTPEVITEVQPYTPMVIEVYIEPKDTQGISYY